MDLSKVLSDGTILLHFSANAPCSFPARPVNDDIETEIHFSKFWVPNAKDSYSVTATGDSMTGARIFEGDMLVIDCGKEPQPRSIIAAWLNGEITIKRLIFEGMRVLLYPENDRYSPIEIKDHDDFRILGVVTSIHRKAE